MTEILATPKSLRIGDHEIPLDGDFELRGRLYDEDERSGFFYNCLYELARERGISSDRNRTHQEGEYYYFLTTEERYRTEPIDLSKIGEVPRILARDAEARTPKYMKSLRIEPRELNEDVASRKVRLLEERINSLHLEGLGVIIPEKWKPPTRAHTILRPEIYCELALVENYQIEIKY